MYPSEWWSGAAGGEAIDTIIAMTEFELEDRLSAPSQADIEAAGRVEGNLLVLGAAGKMGPSLARRVRRAMDSAGNKAEVITVSRGPLPLEGIRHIQCDLLAPKSLDSLPDTPNVIYMAARKFGSTGAPALTWAANTLLPGLVVQRFHKSKIVSFSTGNVYPLVPVESGGATEETPTDPIGEYAWSALGRERMFEHAASTWGTQSVILRLNYACELRYGVLVDLALQVLRGQAIPLAMGFANVIWQGDANSVCFRSLHSCSAPPFVLNLTGPETLSMREMALEFGKRFGKDVTFEGGEAPTALLSNAGKCHSLFGAPSVPVPTLVDWIADWVLAGGSLLNKPTHFQTRDGRF